MKKKTFAGIGSRDTPADVLATMRQLSRDLCARGYTCRTGGATGADGAFADGAGDSCEIYLPWPTFRPGCEHKKKFTHSFQQQKPSFVALKLTLKFHPNPGALTRAAQLLHARNVHILLGENVDEEKHYDAVEFVVCWTPGGQPGGGTGQGIRIAKAYDIPVYNLFNPRDLDEVRKIIAKT